MISPVDRAEKVHQILPAATSGARTVWCDGKWSAADDGRTLSSTDPTTGQPICDFARGGAADVERAVRSAWRAAPVWGAMDGAVRGQIMRRIAELLRERKDDFAYLDAVDAGRPFSDVRISIEAIARRFEFFAGLTDKIRGHTLSLGVGQTGLVEREPYGVIGAITPWNYPISNAATKIAPILACGNAVVVKPAEQAPLSILLLAELCQLAGLPDGALNIVTGLGSETGAALVSHPDVPMISFTGSTTIGRQVAAECGKLLKGATLELGGKSPIIVFDDADMDSAISGAVHTLMMNNGQTCTSCARAIIARPRMEEFLSGVRSKIAALRIGDPLDPDTQIGPLVSGQQRERVHALVAAASSAGFNCDEVAGPQYRPVDMGAFVKPCIITGATLDSQIAQDEVFGPVLTVFPFDDDGEAYALANSTRYGLAASVWTSSLSRADTARASIQAGAIWVNCVHASNLAMPFAPQKASGVGSEFGLEVVDHYMKIKSSMVMSKPYRGMFG